MRDDAATRRGGEGARGRGGEGARGRGGEGARGRGGALAESACGRSSALTPMPQRLDRRGTAIRLGDAWLECGWWRRGWRGWPAVIRLPTEKDGVVLPFHGRRLLSALTKIFIVLGLVFSLVVSVLLVVILAGREPLKSDVQSANQRAFAAEAALATSQNETAAARQAQATGIEDRERAIQRSKAGDRPAHGADLRRRSRHCPRPTRGTHRRGFRSRG